MSILKLFLLLPLTTPLYAGGVVIDIDATLLVQLVIFILFALIMQKLIIHPVMDILDKRACATDGAVQKGKELFASAAEKKVLYDQQINVAKRNAQQKQDEMLQGVVAENHKMLEQSLIDEKAHWDQFQGELQKKQRELAGAILKNTNDLSKLGISKIVG